MGHIKQTNTLKHVSAVVFEIQCMKDLYERSVMLHIYALGVYDKFVMLHIYYIGRLSLN